MAKGGVQIGLSNLVYALLLTDPDPGAGQATYGPVKRVSGAIGANVNPNSSNETLFADDGPYETASTVGQITLELNVADIPLPVQAELYGHTYQNGVLIRKSTDVPPFVAVGYKSLKSNGKYRYTWLAKGKFSAPEQGNETKGDSVNFQTPTTSGSFLKRDCDDEWERHIDEDDVDFVPSMATTWFNGPYGTGSGADTTPPAVQSVVPANNATGVAVNTTVVWTFSEPLKLSTVTLNNFQVLEGGSIVAGDLTTNSARDVVTFTPTSALSASTDYTCVVGTGVQDLAGNNIVSTHITAFETA